MSDARECPRCGSPMRFSRTVNSINDLPMVIPTWVCSNYPECGAVSFDTASIDRKLEENERKLREIEEHDHRWTTRYVAIDGVDCASGMECECGAEMRQDEVEDMLNEKPPNRIIRISGTNKSLLLGMFGDHEIHLHNEREIRIWKAGKDVTDKFKIECFVADGTWED